MQFEKYTESDYQAVCDFLIELSETDRRHINWNWARFEWMYEHPEFDKGSLSSIGLWRDKGKVVGAAIYDMYFGEGFCEVLPGYGELYPEVLEYACAELRDEDGFCFAVCDEEQQRLRTLHELGFSAIAQSETIMERELSGELRAELPRGLSFYSPDPTKDAYQLEWLFWQGFDHGEDRAEFERQGLSVPRVRKHFLRDLGVGAVTGDGELAAFCGGWYCDSTDYVYIEPVCTVPDWRGKGAARAVIFEMLNRARALGAKRAYVISDMDFYQRLGFEKRYHYSFFRKDQASK